MPPVLKGNTTADLIALGHAEESLCLLEVLYRISLNQSLGPVDRTHQSTVSTKDTKLTTQRINRSDSEMLRHESRFSRHSTIGVDALQKSDRHISFGQNSTMIIPSAFESGQERSSSPPPPPPPQSLTTGTSSVVVDTKATADAHVHFSSTTGIGSKGAVPGGPIGRQSIEPPPQHTTATHPQRFSVDSYDKKNVYVRELSKQVQPAVGSSSRNAPGPSIQSGHRASSSLESQRGSNSSKSDMDFVFQKEQAGDDYAFSSRRSGLEPFGMTSEDRVKLMLWLQSFGIQARPPADRPVGSSPGRQPLDVEDEWLNGVLLSEVAAVCSRGNRSEVKEVRQCQTDKNNFSEFYHFICYVGGVCRRVGW